jgi:phage replication initiation protein
LAGSHSVDWAVEQYLAGLFGSGGRKPSCDQKGNWIEPDGTGRTFYVGRRQNGKMLRVYEKGMQLGIPWHPWVRWEVEMHNRDRLIPWDVVQSPGSYTVGAYPQVLSWANEEIDRIVTLHHEANSSYEVLTGHAQRTYGKHINLMLEVEGSPEKVIEKLIRDGLPARLDHLAFLAPGGGRV